MAVRPITIYGDKILREKTKPVNSIDDSVIQNVRDMFDSMRNASGIGLAANQVGLSKSIFVIDLKPIEGYEDFKPLTFINPEIIDESDEIVTIDEGCLSLPNLRAEVDRPKEIKIRFLTVNEEEKEIEADDWLARVILHEYDHLIGKMIPDRVAADIKKKLQKELKDIRERNVDIDYPITEKSSKL